MCELILFITQYYAWFNSTCYHPPLPGPPPGDLHFFFLTWQSILHPRAHRKRRFPNPGTPHRPQYVVLCTKPK